MVDQDLSEKETNAREGGESLEAGAAVLAYWAAHGEFPERPEGGYLGWNR